jgi:anti-sigma28 factor (negative regulator of flagellin synthesis)
MRISDAEVKKILATPEGKMVQEIVDIEEARLREQDPALVQELTQTIAAMPDREAFIEDLKARIAAGEYRPTASEIVDGMIRRAIADRVR